jgi:hypothetical protein
MKHIKFILLVLPFVLFNCNESDDTISKTYPTSQEITALFSAQVLDKTQEFTFDTSTNPATVTTTKGVEISLNTNCLMQDGNPVTGECTLKIVELFDKGDMLVTNKPSVGLHDNGDKSILISAGEFNIEVFKDGLPLETNCGVNVIVPANLSGGVNFDMTLWDGTVNDTIGVVWDEFDVENNQDFFLEAEGGTYYANFGEFGWTNLDIFYSDENPQTTLKVDPPTGYDNANSSVFLSYVGQPNALATLDTFTNEGYFSEHYGMLPIGIQINLIFVSEDDGDFTYATKTVTVEADQVYAFVESELLVASASQLETLVRNLQ